jgi:hypothetical protein
MMTHHRARPAGQLAIALALGLAFATPVSARGDDDDSDRKENGRQVCSRIASLQLEACQHEVKDDVLGATAICINLPDKSEAKECVQEAKSEAREAAQLCREQKRARRSLCRELGEEPYDPDFDPAEFDTDFDSPMHPNPWFPLRIGSTWAYAGDGETISVRVLDRTKLIEGVTCVVVNDRVEEDGKLVEDTDDWVGLRKDGTADYCGEIAQNFESFEGDDPELPELVDVEGSWKAGRDGALPGTLFLGSPVEGALYRQEYAPGDAEDVARVLSTHYGYGSDPELDEHVPAELAELLCADQDCVVTGEFTPLSPGDFERKYYARGVGLFLEVDPHSGNIVQLVACNVDARCAALPGL